jgi:hypothetical protein
LHFVQHGVMFSRFPLVGSFSMCAVLDESQCYGTWSNGLSPSVKMMPD